MNTSSPAAWEVGVARNLSPQMYRALGDPNRLALLVRLASASRPLTVTELADCCGVHISGVSRHLAVMREAGLVACERQGREARYALDLAALTSRLRGLADAIEACCAAGSNDTTSCCPGEPS